MLCPRQLEYQVKEEELRLQLRSSLCLQTYSSSKWILSHQLQIAFLMKKLHLSSSPSVADIPSSVASLVDCSSTPASTPSSSFVKEKELSQKPCSAQNFKGCIHKMKCRNLQRVNKRLRVKLADLKKTISELESVSIPVFDILVYREQ